MSTLIQFLSDNFWATAGSIAAVSTMISGAIIGKLKPNYIWKQVIAWVIAVGLTVGSYFLNIVTVEQPVWFTLTATGLVVGLVSNGIYDIPTIKSFITRLFGV